MRAWFNEDKGKKESKGYKSSVNNEFKTTDLNSDQRSIVWTLFERFDSKIMDFMFILYIYVYVSTRKEIVKYDLQGIYYL